MRELREGMRRSGIDTVKMEKEYVPRQTVSMSDLLGKGQGVDAWQVAHRLTHSI